MKKIKLDKKRHSILDKMSLFLVGSSEAATAAELIMLLELHRDSKKDLGSDCCTCCLTLKSGPSRVH